MNREIHEKDLKEYLKEKDSDVIKGLIKQYEFENKYCNENHKLTLDIMYGILKEKN